MFPKRYPKLLAAIALLAVPLATCQAQYEDHCGPFCEGSSDLRYFEPPDLDLDCLPVDRSCGYIFSYDKLYWAFTGDRTTIGAPGLTSLAEEVYRRNPQDDSGVVLNQRPLPHPSPYTVINGIQDAPPFAGFGWGDRYELGYFNKNRMYTISMLDGPGYSSTEVYGFTPLDLGNPGNDIDGDGVLDENEGTGIFGPPPPGATLNPTALEILLAPSLNGFGSVHVNFAASEDFFLGFRDYWQDIGQLDDDPDFDDVRVVEVGPGDLDPDFPDGYPDDINGNGETFFLVIDGAGNLLIATDYGDLHRFNIRFNTLQVRSTTDTKGIELMKTHIFNNRHKMVKNQNSHLQFGYGMRYFRMTDDFRFDGITDVAGRIFTVTQSENSIVGPQIRVKAEKQTGKWNTSIDTRFMFGYNIQNIDQTNGFGDDALPGAPNKLLFLEPTYSRYGRRADDFTPFLELRAEVKYQVTRALALKAGFNATYVDRMTRSSQVVQYNAPDFGIGAAGEQDIFISGLTFGTEFVH